MLAARATGLRERTSSGRNTLKIEPLPGCDFTLIVPPIASISLRVIARPEAGAAVLAGRRAVRLREGFEQRRRDVGRHADAGVLDHDLHGDRAALRQSGSRH